MGEPSVIMSPLGKKSTYTSVYTPSLLCPLPRSEYRSPLGIDNDSLPFKGMDLWTGYELSWLNAQGKPQVGVGKFLFPCSSSHLIESKSFKLYLNSFNQTRFNNNNEVVKTLESDLSTAIGGPVMVSILPLAKAANGGVGHFAGENIDGLDVSIDSYSIDPSFLQIDVHSPSLRETLYSDLLKTNCPVTGQPDWASVMISYLGRPIDREGLLKYIVSFREHADFHESCVERIFMDILEKCQPEGLSVCARYTRRGGLDINPFRTNCGDELPEFRLVRQ
ncbi:NADPH-dependent 7-cyano-7-deazaguanine reductase QueF [Aurantivibrio infirmus]